MKNKTKLWGIAAWAGMLALALPGACRQKEVILSDSEVSEEAFVAEGNPFFMVRVCDEHIYAEQMRRLTGADIIAARFSWYEGGYS